MMNFGGKPPIFAIFRQFLDNSPLFMENLPKKGPLFREFRPQKPAHMGGTYPYRQHVMYPPPPRDSQTDLLFDSNKQTTQTVKNLPFVIPYDNTSIEIGEILKNNWQHIESDDALKQIWTKQPFVALKIHKNIKDKLVRSKFNR